MREKVTYISNDGVEFNSREMCEYYEEKYSRRINNIRFFALYADPNEFNDKWQNVYYFAIEDDNVLHDSIMIEIATQVFHHVICVKESGFGGEDHI